MRLDFSLKSCILKKDTKISMCVDSVTRFYPFRGTRLNRQKRQVEVAADVSKERPPGLRRSDRLKSDPGNRIQIKVSLFSYPRGVWTPFHTPHLFVLGRRCVLAKRKNPVCLSDRVMVRAKLGRCVRRMDCRHDDGHPLGFENSSEESGNIIMTQPSGAAPASSNMIPPREE